MPQVTASATATGVTVIDPDDTESEIRTNVFRACFIDPYQGEKMADYAVEKLSAKTAAVFYRDRQRLLRGPDERIRGKGADAWP